MSLCGDCSENFCGDSGECGAGFLHCMGKFTRPENKEKILNIFDMYCDLKEALNK